MSRKEYRALAAALAVVNPEGDHVLPCHIARTPREASRLLFEDVVSAIAYVLASDSPRFDAARFRAACGLRATIFDC